MRTYDASKLKSTILGKIKPKRKEIYNVFDKNGRRYLMQLRFYKFKHNFLDTQDAMCKCNFGSENAEHFLLNCHEFSHIRNTLMSNVSRKIIADFHSFSPTNIIKTLLYGDKKYTKDVNTYILNHTINYIKNSKRFKKSLDDHQAV